MKKITKKILPCGAYEALKYNPIRSYKKAKAWSGDNSEYYRNAVKTGQRIFLLNTPWHKNLGDLAIAEAEAAFIKRIMSYKEPVVEVAALSRSIYALSVLKKIIPENATLLFHGGGYLGNDWPIEEEAFRRTVKLFDKNRIILMPQSVFFSGDARGEAALLRSINALSRHNDLHLFARETISYNLMKQYYSKANIYLAPDMVLSMEYTFTEAKRAGVLMCMRADREKSLTDNDTGYIEKISSKYGQVEYTDTFAPDEYVGPINAHTRGPLVNAKLKQFGKARLVVTDRLHGMVFAAITGTPCIAFSNHNHKIKGTAEWINDLNYVRYLEDVDRYEEAADMVVAHGPGRFCNSSLLPHYDTLSKLITYSQDIS